MIRREDVLKSAVDQMPASSEWGFFGHCLEQARTVSGPVLTTIFSFCHGAVAEYTRVK